MPVTSQRSLYKYYSKSGLLRFLQGITVRFTPPCIFNDPFEALPTITGMKESLSDDPWIWDQLQGALAKSFGGNVGALCLSEDAFNLLMWGHYCNAHQGAVVEFDVTHDFFSGSSTEGGFHQYLQKVIFSKRRTALSFDHFHRNKTGFLNDHGSG